jgi:antibiotic biosynthesis monooxygenase (ABM) superfamily enzyme
MRSLLELHEAGLGKFRVDGVVFPALTSVMPVVMFVMLTTRVLLASVVLVSVLSVLAMPLAHAHAMMKMRLNLLVFFG